MRVDEHTFHLDNSPVYYRSAEASGMPKLYLHGIPTSSDDWLEFLRRTGGLAPDLAGFGRSGKGGHLDYSLAGLADFLERFLMHFGVDDVQIVGHDWGAAVALTFADRHPDRVRHLILMNPPPLFGGFEWPQLFRVWRKRGLGELIMGATTKALLARALRHGCVDPDAWPDARITAVWKQFDQGTQRAILRLVRSGWDDMNGCSGPRSPTEAQGGPRSPTEAQGGPRGPVEARGGAHVPGGNRRRTGRHTGRQTERHTGGGSGTPVTLIWGEADPWYPPALADAYAARLEGAAVERIAGAGHWPWLDRPEVVDRVAALLEG